MTFRELLDNPQAIDPGKLQEIAKNQFASVVESSNESLPMKETTARQFIRLSLPSRAPWYRGYTENPLGIVPEGPIKDRREFMGEEDEIHLSPVLSRNDCLEIIGDDKNG